LFDLDDKRSRQEAAIREYNLSDRITEQELSDSIYSPDNSWFEHLDICSKKISKDMADRMVRVFAHTIESDRELSIPKSWMVPDFADRVLSYCSREGIKLTKTRETKSQIFVTGGTVKPRKKRPILIIIHKALKWTLTSSGEAILFNALGDDYAKFDCFNISTLRQQVIEALKEGKNVAVMFEQHQDITILKDVIAKYNVVVLDC